MRKMLSLRAAAYEKDRLQAYLLILLGLILLPLAWLFNRDPFAYPTYPLGLFLFGVGILVAAALNPFRLMIAGILTTLIGAWVFLAFKPQSFIPHGGDAFTLALALGLGLLGIALMARWGYIKAGALTPGIIIVLVGLVEYPPTAKYLPDKFTPFVLSLWLPAIGLLVLGLVYLVTSELVERQRLSKSS